MSNQYGTLVMSDSEVTGNYAESPSYNGFGGGIYSKDATNTLTDCTISGNSAANDGGGGGLCANYSTTALVGCTVSGNSVSGADGSGGGIQTEYGAATLTGCTISGNSVGYNGGGVANYGASLTLTNCTISGNSSGATGGGLGTIPRHDDHADHCTVAANYAATYGGGIDNEGSSDRHLGRHDCGREHGRRCGGPDAFGTFHFRGNNLIGETDGSSGWGGSTYRHHRPAARCRWSRLWGTTAGRPDAGPPGPAARPSAPASGRVASLTI